MSLTTEASHNTMEEEEKTQAAEEDLHLQELINGSWPSLPPQSTSRVLPLGDDEIETFYCGICMESKLVFDRFHCHGCRHHFCISCLVQYIQLRIAGGKVPIRCPEPGCGDGVLDREACKKLVDYEVYLAWGAALGSAAAAGAGTFTYRACMEWVDVGEGRCNGCRRAVRGKEVEEESGGVVKEEEKEASTSELRELAAERGWRRCPGCGILIEKISGCSSMRCRCGCKFCYSCGAPSPRRERIRLRRRTNERKEQRESLEMDLLQLQPLEDFIFDDEDVVFAQALMTKRREDLRRTMSQDEERSMEESEAETAAKREAKIMERTSKQAGMMQIVTNDGAASSSHTPENEDNGDSGCNWSLEM